MKNKGLSNIGFNFLLVLIVLAGIFVAANIFLKQQEEYYRVEKRASDLATLDKIITADKESVEERSESILSIDDIENLARNELGMLKPGEIIFKDADRRDIR